MKLLRDRSGQGVLEYGLILGLVAMIAVGTLMMLGSESNSTLASFGGALGSSPTSSVKAPGGSSTLSGQ